MGLGGLLPGYSHLEHHVPRAREPVAPCVDQPARDALELWPDRPLLEAVQGDEGDRLARGGTDPPLGMRWAAGVGGRGAPAAPASPPASPWGTLRPPPLSLCARRVPVRGTGFGVCRHGVWSVGLGVWGGACAARPPPRGRPYLGCISLHLGCILVSAAASVERTSKHDSIASGPSWRAHGSTALDATSLSSSRRSRGSPAAAAAAAAACSKATSEECSCATEASGAGGTPIVADRSCHRTTSSACGRGQQG